ncbi:MAG: DMT family transporter [Anaerolineae bacterium]|nr:MAG: DMT family transporter [Anaerolineae bacterium]
MKNDQRVWTAFILLSLFWGTSFLFIKIGLRTLDPFMLVTIRLIIGWLGLMAILKWRGMSLPKGWSNWRHVIFLGIFNTAVPFTLITWAESGDSGIDSTIAAVLNSTVPLFSFIIAGIIIQSEKITLNKVTGLMVGFFGIIILMSRGFSWEANSLLPPLAVVAASLCYAVSSVYGKQYVSHLDPVAISAGQLLTAELIMVVATLFIVDFSSQALNMATVGSLLWLGLLGTCAAYILYYYILQNWGATRTTLVTYLLPVVGVTAGVLLLNEALEWQLVMGGLLIISGIVIVNWRPKRRPLIEAEGQGLS